MLALLGILAAVLLRFVHLGAEGLWVDEAYTVNLVDGSFAEILGRLQLDEAPPLFYFLEKAAVSLFGSSEAGARILPAVAGAASVLVAFLLTRRHAPAASLPALFLFAFSTVAIFYSQQARSYSLLHLLGTLLLFAALELRSGPSNGRLAAFLILSLGLLYTHNLSFWSILAALAIIAPALWRDRGGRRSGLILLAFLLLGAIPWASLLVRQIGMHEELNRWMGHWWEGKRLLSAPFYTGLVFSNGAAPWVHPPIPLPGLPESLGVLRFGSWILMGIGFLVAGWRARGSGNGDATSSRAFLVFALAPLLGLLLTSALLGPAYVLGRTDTLALPGFLLTLAVGWSVFRPRWLLVLALGFWVFTGVATSLSSGSEGGRTHKRSDRELAQKLGQALGPEDALVVPSLARPSLEYYGRRQGWADRLELLRSFPPSADRNPAAVIPTPLDSAEAYRRQALDLRSQWERRGVRSAWVLGILEPTNAPEIRAWPLLPTPPPPNRAEQDANALSYPMNLVLYSLVGLNPMKVIWEYRQDWVGGQRVALRIDREDWIPVDSLPGMEIRP